MILVLVLVALQGTAPLRKSDLVRLLSGSALSAPEIAQLVERNCLTFRPSDRDRDDLAGLGADPSLLAAMDACARKKPPPTPRSTAMKPTRVTPAPPPAGPAPPPPAPPAPASAERSTFVQGGGQRGVVATRLPRALAFEVRDSGGVPLPGRSVAFTGINARIDPATALTDGLGQARVVITLGERAGSATVLATTGAIEKQVAFSVAAGPARELAVFCGESGVSVRLTIRPDTSVRLRVVARDAFSNPTPLLGLRAAAADPRVFRVQEIAQDSVSGTVVLRPGQPGTTSLAVMGNGMRQYLSVTVSSPAAAGTVDCPLPSR